MQLVLDTHGLTVKVRNRSFQIIGKEEKRLIGPERLTSIAVTADCLFSTAALRLAIERHIPVYLMDETGDVAGKLWSPHFVGLAALRRAQALWLETDNGADAGPARWATQIVGLKTARQIEHLRRRSADTAPPDASPGEQLLDTDYRTALLAFEAQAAKAYWQALSGLVPDAWRFEGRSRRPALDPFNAALNYLYGMLYPAVEGAVFAAGLDPYMGLLHAEDYDRPALTFDLIEPFRPWADELLLDLCHEAALDIRHFEPRDGGWWVGKAAKAVLIPRFNDFLLTEREADGATCSVRNHIYAYAGQLADHIREWHTTFRKS